MLRIEDQIENSTAMIKTVDYIESQIRKINSDEGTADAFVAEAKKHISNADKIIADKTNVTVSRNANGTTTYTAYFYTEDKRITVELDSNLKLIEVKEKVQDKCDHNISFCFHMVLH